MFSDGVHCCWDVCDIDALMCKLIGDLVRELRKLVWLRLTLIVEMNSEYFAKIVIKREVFFKDFQRDIPV